MERNRKCLISILMLIIFTSTGLTEAAIFYGTERFSGDIYAIDTKAGTIECLVNLASLAPDFPLAGDSPNGNAFDSVNNRFYFTSFFDPGCPANYSIEPSELYFVDISNPTDIVWAGTLSGHASDGAFYNGQYWYIRHGTNELAVVDIMADGTIASEEDFGDIMLTDPTTGVQYEPYIAFGDIEFDSNGKLYLTGRNKNSVMGTHYISGTFDTETGLFTEIGYRAYWVQIAFGEDGWLYGHATGTGEFYRINTVSGTIMNTVLVDSPQLTDIASKERGTPKMPKKQK